MNANSQYLTKLLALLVLALAGNVSAEERVYTGDSIGSTHTVGYDYEVVKDEHSTQYSIGLFGLAPTGTITWKRFYSRNGSRFYYGAGPWMIVAITSDEAGMLAAARAVAGMEWDLPDNAKWGIELSINLPLYVKTFWGPERSVDQLSAFPLPGIFYRKSF